MIDKIKAFIVANWKKIVVFAAYGAVWYVIGAITGAWIQRLIG